MDMRDGNTQLGKLLLLLRMIGSLCLDRELLEGLRSGVGLGIVSLPLCMNVEWYGTSGGKVTSRLVPLCDVAFCNNES